MSQSPPNILVIMSDQHRYDVLGAAGHRHVQTPTLDALARNGTQFTQAYCNNPLCVPSRLSFLSGKTSNQIGVWSLSDELRSDELTWPSLLGAGGYDTAVAGRMHHWWPDKLHGFQQRLCGETRTGVASTVCTVYEPGTRRDEQTAVLRKFFRKELAPGATGCGDHPGWKKDREATDQAVQYIERKRDRAGVPWALCVGYVCPHSPMRFPAEYFDRYRHVPIDDVPPFDKSLAPMWHTFARTLGFDQPVDQQTAKNAIRAYLAMVNYLDDLVGNLVAALERSGQRDNTIIVYTSDHGEMLGQRGLWCKSQLLEPSIRVPLLFNGPGIAAGATPSMPVSLLDLFPTFAQLGDAPMWDHVPGRSLAPLLSGRDDPSLEDRPVFIEYADYGIGQPAACIRRQMLKLIAARQFEPMLFDLQVDPDETTNRYNDPAYAPAVRQLEQDLATYWDAEDTWRRVVHNQNRIDIIRRSQRHATNRHASRDDLAST